MAGQVATEQDNLRIVKEAYACFQRGDIPGVIQTLAEDIDWLVPGPSNITPLAGRRRGLEQVKQFFADIDKYEEIQQFEPREFLAQGDKVVTFGHYRARVKSTGRVFESDFAQVLTLRDGKATKFQDYYDTFAGAEAFRTPTN